MIVYRIAKKEHAALDGLGGLYGPGRWHKKGNLVIYTSEHASLAAWEKIVHVASVENLPEGFYLIKIELPETIVIQEVPKKIFVKGWNGFPFINETVDYGTSFLKAKEHLALKVPSVIIPDEYNIILNPLHPDINRCGIISMKPFTFDRRALKDS
ncbi:MAG: RES family NAD+ phosphorylase [Verrucomicrobia bacterium]|nr:RES family NAD+ phosphorylase [Prolixibacteraceae bacterium]